MAENEEAGEHTVLWFYYSGHGLMATNDYTLHAVCRHWDKEKKNFNIEKELTTLAKQHKNLYVIGLFDRCRKSESTSLPESQTFGFTSDVPAPVTPLSSYIFYFTNASCENIKEDSTISYKFFKTLAEKVDKLSGKITFPSDMSNWIQPDKNAPHVIGKR